MMPAGRLVTPGQLAARTMLLTPPNYVTVRGAGTTPNIIQGEEDWLDVSQFADITAWIDVTEVTAPSNGVVTLQLETSPTGDDSTFTTVIGQIPLSVTGTPAVFTSASGSNAPLSKYLRWKLINTGTSGSWDATLRIRVMGNRTRYFTPTQLGTCVFWLRPDYGLTIPFGRLNTWAERSGFDANKLLTTASNVPPTFILNSASYGNQPAVSMSSSAYMTSPLWTVPLSQPDTWVVVGNPGGVGAAQVAFESNDTVSGQDLQQNGSNDIQIATTFGFASTQQWTTPGVVLAEYDGASPNSNIYFNNFTTPVATGSVGSGGNAGQNSLTLGASDAAFPPAGAFWNGLFLEVMAFSSILTVSQKSLLRTYLSNRYGVAIG